MHVYDTGYIRVEAISQEVNNENCYVLWTNNSYPQNKRIEALEVTVRQINDLTLSVQKLAINMEHMLVNQTEQSKRLEELENRDGEKWRSISMYVLTALIGAVLGFALKEVGL